ncbi:MAG: amidohydrolase [Limisphaerales bacterium]
MYRVRLLVVLAIVSQLHAADPKADVKQQFAAIYPQLESLYQHLHRNPELSYMEKETSARMAAEFRKAGFTVTERVGGYGVVGRLKNGEGPTIMLRCDMDALPVEEKTGLPFGSRKQMTNEAGKKVFTMHACGHDIHMTSAIGTIRVLSALKNHWSGTLMVIAQPAEERGGGARAMLGDGLFQRFALPDKVIGLHVNPALPAGRIGYTPGFAMANVDSVDIKIFGVGGHGAYPHAAKDPIVLAAQTILALQTVVSREIAPIEPGVITVGSIHGGTKHNIIPREVDLQLTVRSYSDETREMLLNGIKRIAKGLAVAAGLPEDKLPVVKIKDEYTPATYNNPELTRRLVGVFEDWLGKGVAIERKPQMGGEDFGRYGRTKHKLPICMYFLGASSPKTIKRAMQGGSLPSLHSPLFAPDFEPTIRTGVIATSAAILDLMSKN